MILIWTFYRSMNNTLTHMLMPLIDPSQNMVLGYMQCSNAPSQIYDGNVKPLSFPRRNHYQYLY